MDIGEKRYGNYTNIKIEKRYICKWRWYIYMKTETDLRKVKEIAQLMLFSDVIESEFGFFGKASVYLLQHGRSQ